MSQSKLESSVKFCWSRGLGPWQHSCRMCYRMEFIKIPLHTEHMYSPEEVKEEDLQYMQYTSELRRCTAYNMKAKNRLRICTFTHTRKLKVGMYVCTMQLCTVHFEHCTHTDELGLASAGMSLSIFLLSAAMMIQPWPRRSVILRNEFCCHKKTKKEEEEARDLLEPQKHQ